MTETSSSYDQIIQATREALSRRDSRRDILAAQIHGIASAALDAARVPVIDMPGAGTLRYEEVSATCSQWANQKGPEHTEEHLVLVAGGETRSIGPLDLGYYDGANTHWQTGPTRDSDGDEIRPATVAQLRAVARELPAAVATLLAQAQATAEAEAAEAEEVAAELAADRAELRRLFPPTAQDEVAR